MKTIKTLVYNFDELNAAAKEKAREWWREGPCAWDSDCQIESVKEDLVIAGFNIEKVYFSGFSSQGDGACFEGTWRALDVFRNNVNSNASERMKEHAPLDSRLHQIAAECERIAKLFPLATLRVKHCGHYYHRFCTDFTISICDSDGNEIETPEAGQVEKDLIEVSRDAMNWIYCQLEADYNWHNENEQVDDALIANEYTFTEDGKRFG